MDQDLPTKFLIDGIDRLGKSTLIEQIMDIRGYHLVIHYDKPKLLTNLLFHSELTIQDGHSDSIGGLDPKTYALKLYQEETNRHMFDLMRSNVPIIFDRTHLGECVYSPLYRKYSGDYVFELERDFIKSKPFTHSYDVRLVLLTASNFDMLQDDGLSFDSSKKEEEQKMFVNAFNRSRLPNKVIVDVHNGSGGYRSKDDILSEALFKLPG